MGFGLFFILFFPSLFVYLLGVGFGGVMFVFLLDLCE